MPTNVRRKSLAEEISAQLAEAILRGDYGADGRIGTKDELQGQLGVARGTINEIVRLLSSRQVIQMRPGPKGGLFAVSSPTVKFADMVLRLQNDAHLTTECFQVKDMLDPIVAVHAARYRTAKDVKELREICKEYERQTEPKTRVRWNWKLHRRISEISKNRILVIFYAAIMDLVEAELSDVQAKPDKARMARRGALHRELVEAIADGDEKRARTLGGDKHRFEINLMGDA
jgi:DNA-binding FadR family transcriptional regulator